jgi:hypothetical protein
MPLVVESWDHGFCIRSEPAHEADPFAPASPAAPEKLMGKAGRA